MNFAIWEDPKELILSHARYNRLLPANTGWCWTNKYMTVVYISCIRGSSNVYSLPIQERLVSTAIDTKNYLNLDTWLKEQHTLNFTRITTHFQKNHLVPIQIEKDPTLIVIIWSTIVYRSLLMSLLDHIDCRLIMTFWMLVSFISRTQFQWRHIRVMASQITGNAIIRSTDRRT